MTSTAIIEPTWQNPPPPITEDRLRQALAAQPYLGDWDEWTKTPLGGYNALTVTARSVLSHLHGNHDDTENPYAYCVLCTAFRAHPAEADENGSEGAGQ